MRNRDHNNHDQSKNRHYNDDFNRVTDKVEFADENEFLDQSDSNDHNKQRKNNRQSNHK